MVAEASSSSWILRMGNQVGNNLKHAALFLDPSSSSSSKKTKTHFKTDKKSHHHHHQTTTSTTIGILSFEIANIMTKIIHLHKSLTNQEISRLTNDVFKSHGVNHLISHDPSVLLGLAFAEKLEDLNRISAVVSRLGKKCSEPALLGFEHVYNDLLSHRIDFRDLGFLVKDMDSMIRKMERYVNSTSNLFNELEVLNDLEQTAKKFPSLSDTGEGVFLSENRRVFEQKILWQRQDVNHLRDASLWNQSFDKIVGLLARTVCTIYARICFVFKVDAVGFHKGDDGGALSLSPVSDENGESTTSTICSGQIAGHHPRGGLLRDGGSSIGFKSGPIERSGPIRGSGEAIRTGELSGFRNGNFISLCGSGSGRIFLECLSLSSSAAAAELEDGDEENEGRHSRRKKNHTTRTTGGGFNNSAMSPPSCFNGGNGIPFSGEQKQSQSDSGSVGGVGKISVSASASLSSKLHFGAKCRLMNAPPSTVGGSALALHYANVIIVVEKLLRYPHLVGDEARNDLYQMLPTSLRASLRTNLKSYVKNLASAIYDAPLAHDWREALDRILRWLAPLAHNMIRWQTEHNFEQQQFVTRTNVLLLQTLYYADREKTEAAICELLVGLNYICRYEHQQNALMDSASSQDFDEYMEWQLHY